MRGHKVEQLGIATVGFFWCFLMWFSPAIREPRRHRLPLLFVFAMLARPGARRHIDPRRAKATRFAFEQNPASAETSLELMPNPSRAAASTGLRLRASASAQLDA
jgi:hypothetical protein